MLICPDRVDVHALLHQLGHEERRKLHRADARRLRRPPQRSARCPIFTCPGGVDVRALLQQQLRQLEPTRMSLIHRPRRPPQRGALVPIQGPDRVNVRALSHQERRQLHPARLATLHRPRRPPQRGA